VIGGVCSSPTPTFVNWEAAFGVCKTRVNKVIAKRPSPVGAKFARWAACVPFLPVNARDPPWDSNPSTIQRSIGSPFLAHRDATGLRQEQERGSGPSRNGRRVHPYINELQRGKAIFSLPIPKDQRPYSPLPNYRRT
jgi:hypothetical protein